LLAEPDAKVDPLRLFRKYVNARDNFFPHHPHLWLGSDGTIPTRAWFMRYLRRFFPPTISGHSMRAGGATALAASGVLCYETNSEEKRERYNKGTISVFVEELILMRYTYNKGTLRFWLACANIQG